MAWKHTGMFSALALALTARLCTTLCELLKLYKPQLLHLQNGVITTLALPQKAVRIEAHNTLELSIGPSIQKHNKYQ